MFEYQTGKPKTLARKHVTYEWVIMDREDLPRISVDSTEDWARIKSNFASAVMSKLDSGLSSNSSSRRDVLTLYMNQVRDLRYQNWNFEAKIS